MTFIPALQHYWVPEPIALRSFGEVTAVERESARRISPLNLPILGDVNQRTLRRMHNASAEQRSAVRGRDAVPSHKLDQFEAREHAQKPSTSGIVVFEFIHDLGVSDYYFTPDGRWMEVPISWTPATTLEEFYAKPSWYWRKKVDGSAS